MQKTNIGWTDYTSNPIRAIDRITKKTGWACTKISPGCAHCYAEQLNRRLGTGKPFEGLANHYVEWVLVEKELASLWKHFHTVREQRSRIFLGDMTDLFHERVFDKWLDQIFAAMWNGYWHDYQILTKRPDRMHAYLTADGREEAIATAAYNLCQKFAPSTAKKLDLEDFLQDVRLPLPNVSLGVSVENQRLADERIPWLMKTPAAVRFLSVEPLLGAMRLWKLTEPYYEPGYSVGREVYPFSGLMAIPDADWSVGSISWVIVGGESGPGRRPMEPQWLRSIVKQCRDESVPVFVKQDSTLRPGQQGRIPDELWALKQFPVVAQGLPSAEVSQARS